MRTLHVSVSSLKAKLAEYLRLVKKGACLVVLDHKHPVAKVAPITQGEESGFASIKPIENPSLRGFFPSRKIKRSFSSLDLLLEDRKKR